jgi:hypothetical protein
LLPSLFFNGVYIGQTDIHTGRCEGGGIEPRSIYLTAINRGGGVVAGTGKESKGRKEGKKEGRKERK